MYMYTAQTNTIGQSNGNLIHFQLTTRESIDDVQFCIQPVKSINYYHLQISVRDVCFHK